MTERKNELKIGSDKIDDTRQIDMFSEKTNNLRKQYIEYRWTFVDGIFKNIEDFFNKQVGLFTVDEKANFTVTRDEWKSFEIKSSNGFLYQLRTPLPENRYDFCVHSFNSGEELDIEVDHMKLLIDVSTELHENFKKYIDQYVENKSVKTFVP